MGSPLTAVRLVAAVGLLMFPMVAAGPEPAASATGSGHLGTPQAALGAAASDAALDGYLRSQLGEVGLPGLSAAVVRAGKIEHLVAFGKADDTGRAMTPQTPVLLASLSKGFTALAVMELVQAGKIELSAPVQRYLPWFRVADQAASRQITVTDLLHHTSGLPSSADASLLKNGTAAEDPDALEKGVRNLSGVSLRDVPGRSFEYANVNYNTLGLIVQTVSAESYSNYLQDHVFAPMQMSRTYADTSQAQAGGLAEGFSTFFGSYRQRSYPVPAADQPSAGLLSSSEDLGHVIEMYLQHGTYRGARLISAATEKALHAPAVAVGEASYSMGWWIRPQWELSTQPGDPTADAKVAKVVEHSGTWNNTRTFMAYIPATGMGVVLLVNANSAPLGSRISAVEGNLWRVLLGLPLAPYVPDEEFLGRYGWQIGALVVLLQLIVAGWSIWLLRRRAHHGIPLSRLRDWPVLVLPGIFDGFVLWLTLLYVPPHFNSTYVDIIRGSPDIGIFLVAAVTIAALWGCARTVLLLYRPTRKDTSGTAATTPARLGLESRRSSSTK